MGLVRALFYFAFKLAGNADFALQVDIRLALIESIPKDTGA